MGHPIPNVTGGLAVGRTRERRYAAVNAQACQHAISSTAEAAGAIPGANEAELAKPGSVSAQRKCTFQCTEAQPRGTQQTTARNARARTEPNASAADKAGQDWRGCNVGTSTRVGLVARTGTHGA